MRHRTPLVVTAVAVALIGGSAIPAMAATTGSPTDTTTTFALTGGNLALSVPTSAALGDKAAGQTAITGFLGATSVTDLRGGTAPWTVTAGSGVFDLTTGTVATSKSTSVHYTAGALDNTGTDGSITVTSPGVSTLITSPASVVAPTALSGNNITRWNPALDVLMPASSLAGSYTGTVTTSIA
jgi:hypothetical protein